MTERLELLTQRQRMANALGNFLTKQQNRPTLYCPLCRQHFPTDDEAHPPYSAIHKYTEVPTSGEGPGINDAAFIHIHPITREELHA